jgi:CHAT domain-containing protein
MVLAPVAGPLTGAKRVYLVPDGPLSFVPFDALLRDSVQTRPGSDPDSRNAFFAGLPYALSDAEICYGPSASALCLLVDAAAARSRAERPMEFLAVGDPAFAQAALAPLPFTREEVQAIGAYFPPDRSTVLLGAEASEAAVRRPGFLGDYRILHLATHGLVDERRPDRSSIALAEPADPTEDGFLRAQEIYRLDLNADLVVLSACETGLGKMLRGEGVLGLPRAFFFAGVPRIVVSLWSVSDRSTADLMKAFYGELVRSRKPPGRALAGAKKTMRAGGFAHPFYWAPFVLIGPS